MHVNGRATAMFKFKLDTIIDDRERWMMIIVQHVNLFLWPLRQRCKSVVVHFYDSHADSDQPPLYSCELKIRRSDEKLDTVKASHGDGLVAIAHAMARAHRSLSRLPRLQRPPAPETIMTAGRSVRSR